jgi:hypothetical protein
LVQEHQRDIFYISHPSCSTADCKPSISVRQEGSAVVEEVSWQGGFTGKPYQTQLIFSPSYDNAGQLSSVAIEAVETNNPLPPAFFAAERGKNVAMTIVSGWLRSKGGMAGTAAALTVKMADQSVSVKQLLSLALAHFANAA